MSATAFNVAMQSEIITDTPAAQTSVAMSIFFGNIQFRHRDGSLDRRFGLLASVYFVHRNRRRANSADGVGLLDVHCGQKVISTSSETAKVRSLSLSKRAWLLIRFSIILQ